MLLTEYDEVKTMDLFFRDGRAEGLVEGRAEGRAEGERTAYEKLSALTAKLLAQGRGSDALKAMEDAACREALFAEFRMA